MLSANAKSKMGRTYRRLVAGPMLRLLAAVVANLVLANLVLANLVLAGAGPARAQDVVKPLKAGRLAVSFAYQFDLLDEAMKRSVPRYGPFVERPFVEPMSASRDQIEGARGELINVLIAEPGLNSFDQNMVAIPIDLDRGLHGTRIALIRKDAQAKLDGVRTLDDLRRLVVGQGLGWGDVKIFRNSGVPVETPDTYESILTMLHLGRIDLFPRGASEIGEEFAKYHARYPELAIEQHLVIKYRFPHYFYVSKNAPRLVERISYGLKEMIRDGSFDALFDRYFGKTIADLNLDQRTVIELDNPFLPAWAKQGP